MRNFQWTYVHVTVALEMDRVLFRPVINWNMDNGNLCDGCKNSNDYVYVSGTDCGKIARPVVLSNLRSYHDITKFELNLLNNRVTSMFCCYIFSYDFKKSPAHVTVSAFSELEIVLYSTAFPLMFYAVPYRRHVDVLSWNTSKLGLINPVIIEYTGYMVTLCL